MKTVIVLGAGASAEAGLPTGQDLKKKISELLDLKYDPFKGMLKKGDDLIYDALKTHYRTLEGENDFNDYSRAAQHVSYAMPQAESIDNFIDSNRGDAKIELCGKLAIVRSILQAEKGSLLYINPTSNKRFDYSRLESTWYARFFKLLVNNCLAEDLEERLRHISLIIFNYDRCLEQYLFIALQNYYRITADESARLVNNIEIFHPYGVVGHLPWQNNGDSIAFGDEPDVNQLLHLVTLIKTFTEGTDRSHSDILVIHRKFIKANIVVFLGFAFHSLNMKLMRPSDNDGFKPRDKQYYATALGISDSNCDVIRRDIEKLCSSNSEISLRNKLGCYELFDEFSRSFDFTDN